MTRPALFLLFIGLLATGVGAVVPHQHVIARATGSVVRLTRGADMMTMFGPTPAQYTCTGFVIAPGRVLTAAHCVGERMTADGLPVEILKKDTAVDLALLQSATGKPALVIEEVPLTRGAHVTAIGYGYGFTQVTLVEGVVMLVDYQMPPDSEMALPPEIFVQGEYIGGMSGGPVLNSAGRVVGIVQMHGEGVGLGVGTLLMRAFLLGL